eukprot:TRINITY_DN5516_c0_g2_i1.p1 TRINITY_DN5516_c0_g2~~TRINITY_DN5516_c0_g2_i1.p1  ORF type:complete len:229 (+),score=56.66 TRINITY_DN5516_c0_g2_i1:50-688(+)
MSVVQTPSNPTEWGQLEWVHQMDRTPRSDSQDTGSIGTSPQALSTTSSEGRNQHREFLPCCDHNNWDNVRVSKRVMTLRCRVCQNQWRAHVEEVWTKWKCAAYSWGTCHPGCKKLHINYRKQGLEARFNIHGEAVVEQVRVGRTQPELQEKVDRLMLKAKEQKKEPEDRDREKESASRTSSPALSVSLSTSSNDTFTHSPYSWGNVSPPSLW